MLFCKELQKPLSLLGVLGTMSKEKQRRRMQMSYNLKIGPVDWGIRELNLISSQC